MEIKTVETINKYVGSSINPLDNPEQVYELYSVPSFDNQYPEIIKGSKIGSSKITVEENDILVCKINPRINRVWVVKHNTEYPLLASSEWIVVRNREMDSNYLKWYFSSPHFRELLTSQVAGIGGSLTRAQPKQVAKYPVPVPDISKQKEIATVLDKVSDLIALRKQQLAKLDELVKARFVELFGDPKYNKSNLVKIGEIGALTSGGTPSRAKPEYFEGDIRWYSAGELNSLYLADSIEHISETALHESSAKLFDKGTLLIGMYDTAAFKMGILTENASSNQACANLNPKQGYNIVWLYYLFDMMKPIFLQERQGVRQKNLSLSKIKEFEIPVAPFELQEEFAAFVEQTDKSKSEIQTALTKLEALKKALMQQYFE